ncbi:hypothetical protein J2129_001053 [Methanofollis sp. W23]|nr:hypothetical protein [Methanofollis sp. W23]
MGEHIPELSGRRRDDHEEGRSPLRSAHMHPWPSHILAPGASASLTPTDEDWPGTAPSPPLSLSIFREKQESSGIASERWTLPPHGEAFFSSHLVYPWNKTHMPRLISRPGMRARFPPFICTFPPYTWPPWVPGVPWIVCKIPGGTVHTSLSVLQYQNHVRTEVLSGPPSSRPPGANQARRCEGDEVSQGRRRRSRGLPVRSRETWLKTGRHTPPEEKRSPTLGPPPSGPRPLALSGSPGALVPRWR